MKALKPILTLLLVILAIGSLFYIRFTERSPDKNPLTTRIEKGDIEVVVRGRGEVIAEKTYKIVSPFSGMIQAIFKDEGEKVEKGELLLSLDKTELLVKLKEAEKNILQCKNRLLELKEGMEIKRLEKEIKEVELSYKEAEREYESNSRLYELKAIPKETLLTSESILLKNEANLRLKKEELSSLKRKMEDESKFVLLQLKEAEANSIWIKKQIAWADIKSPVSGIIIEKNPDITPGYTVGPMTHLFTIIPDSYQVKGLIDEADIENIHLDQKARVLFDAYPYKPCEAWIKKISPKPISLEEKGGIRRFEVYLEIDPPFKITPKMQCSLEVKRSLSNVVKIRLEDILEEDGKRYVFIKEEDKKLKREIKTGLENDSEAQVLSGLKEGDVIFKTPSLEIK